MENASGDVAERAALVRTMMRRQARLGLRIAAIFVLILVGLPLLNLYLPDAMSTRVGGFSCTWLLLAVLFYPVTWLLSWRFVKGSDRAEDEIVAEMRGRVEAVSTAPLSAPPPTPSSSPVGSGTMPEALRRSDEEGAQTPKRKLFVEEDEA